MLENLGVILVKIWCNTLSNDELAFLRSDMQEMHASSQALLSEILNRVS